MITFSQRQWIRFARRHHCIYHVNRHHGQKRDCTFRDYLARGELLGAVRLPDTAFKTAAGTSVNSDIIFLKKEGKGLIDEQYAIRQCGREVV